MIANSSKSKMEKIGLGLFLVFVFSIFIAKPVINLTYGLLIFLSLIYLIGFGAKNFLPDKKYVLILMVPFFFGFISSFFSLAGYHGAIDFLSRYRFLLLVVPFAVFIRNKDTVMQVILAMNFGAFLNITYCLYNSDLTQPFGNIFGIHKFGRNSDMLFTLCLINVTALLIKYRLNEWQRNSKVNSLLFINTCIIFITIMLIGQRAAYLGLYIGMFVLFLLFSRKLFIGLLILTILSPLFAPEYMKTRVNSVIDLTYASNSVRLDLIKLGIDLITGKKCYLRGTGAGNIESELERIFADRPLSYHDKYYATFKQFPDNFHNSYLQMAVEVGVLFLILYLSSIFFLLLKIFKKLNNSNSDGYIIFPCVIVTAAGFLVSQTVHEEFFRYGGLVFFTIFYSGCMLASNRASIVKSC